MFSYLNTQLVAWFVSQCRVHLSPSLITYQRQVIFLSPARMLQTLPCLKTAAVKLSQLIWLFKIFQYCFQSFHVLYHALHIPSFNYLSEFIRNLIFISCHMLSISLSPATPPYFIPLLKYKLKKKKITVQEEMQRVLLRCFFS